MHASFAGLLLTLSLLPAAAAEPAGDAPLPLTGYNPRAGGPCYGPRVTVRTGGDRAPRGFPHPGRWAFFGYRTWGYPAWGYPAWGHPAFGYPVLPPAFPIYGYPPLPLSSIETFASIGLPYGYLGYSRLPAPAWYPQAPRIIDASQVVVNPPAPAVEPAPAPGERFYLDPQPEPPALDPIEAARRRLEVDEVEPGLYLVRWTGSTEGLALIEFQSVDAAGQVLGSRVVRSAPFRGLLRVPAKTAAVIVTLEREDGSSGSIKLPLTAFTSLTPAR